MTFDQVRELLDFLTAEHLLPDHPSVDGDDRTKTARYRRHWDRYGRGSWAANRKREGGRLSPRGSAAPCFLLRFRSETSWNGSSGGEESFIPGSLAEDVRPLSWTVSADMRPEM